MECRLHTKKRFKATFSGAAKMGHVECLKNLVEDASFKHLMAGLVAASDYGQQECIRVLVKAGADVNRFSECKRRVLSVAARSGNASCVKELIAIGANVNARDESGFTAVHEAVLMGRQDCLKELVAAGADVQITNYNGTTPLFDAAARGKKDCLKILIDAATDVMKGGFTPLMAAIENGHTSCCKALLETKVCENQQRAASALTLAIKHGNVDIVKALIEYGAPVKDVTLLTQSTWERPNLKRFPWTSDSDSYESDNSDSESPSRVNATPLTVAAGKGHREILELLIKAGANVNEADENQYTPLMRAIQSNSFECFTELLKAGASVNTTEGSDSSPLSVAVELDRHEFLTKLVRHKADVNRTLDGLSVLAVAARIVCDWCVTRLLQAGAQVNTLCSDGASSLLYAVQGSSESCVKRLIEAGAVVNVVANDLSTPLTAAASVGSVEIVAELLNVGANVNYSDKTQQKWLGTALARAVRGKHSTCVEKLLQAGADVNIPNHYGHTPMHEAVLAREVKILTCLLKPKYKGNVDSKDILGHSPLHVAAYYGFLDCVELLLQAKADKNSKDVHGSSCLMTALERGHEESARRLFLAGVNVDAMNQEGHTALTLAKIGSAMLRLLIRTADVNLTKNGHSALKNAAEANSAEYVNKLLDAGAKINSRAGGSDTALMVAVSAGSVWAVCVLVRRGADVNKPRSTDGYTPLMIATQNYRVKSTHVLLNAGAVVNTRCPKGDTALSVCLKKMSSKKQQKYRKFRKNKAVRHTRFLGDLRWVARFEPNRCEPNQSTYRQHLPKVCLQQFHGQDEN